MRTLKKSVILLSVFSILFATSCNNDDDSIDNKKEEPAKPERDLYKVETVMLTTPENVVNGDGAIYFSFKDNKSFALSKKDAKESKDWDIAFDQVNGYSNGGTFGSGETSVYLTNYTNFDDVVNYTPFVSKNDWVQTQEMKVLSFRQMPPVEVTGNYNPLLVKFYTFKGGHPPKADIDPRIRIIKTNDGKYVKLQFLGIYEKPEIPSGFPRVSFKYVYLKDTGENAVLLRDGEKRIKDVSAGNLKDKLTDDEWAAVKILTVESGVLNQKDIDFIKDLKVIEELDLGDASLSIGPYEPFLKSNRNSLKKVIMPKNLVTIGQGWFAYSPNLEEVVVEGNALEGVLDGAFASCKKLKKVTLPNSLLSLGYQAFYYSGLETFTCPEKVEEIAYSTFERCTNLKEVFLPNIKKIKPKAFWYCTKLEKLHINAKKAPELISQTTGKLGYIIKGYPITNLTLDNADGTPYFRVYVPKGSKDGYVKDWDWTGIYTKYITEEE